MLRRASRPERRDDDQAPAAAGAWEREDTRPVRSVGGLGVGRGRGQQFADAGDVGGAIAVSQESVVADAVEAPRQDVENEAPDELVGRERHGLVAAGPVDPVVLDPEGDAVCAGPDQAAVGDGHAVGVAAEIGEHRLGSCEGFLGVDDPLDPAQGFEEGVEGGSVGEARVIAEEGEAALSMELDQPVEKQAPEQPREHAHGEEEVRPARDPLRPVRRQSTTRHDHVHVRVMGHRRAPAMEHRGDADPCAEMLALGGNGERGLGAGSHQQVVDDPFVLVRDVGDLCRQGEDEVEIADG